MHKIGNNRDFYRLTLKRASHPLEYAIDYECIKRRLKYGGV